MASSISDDAVNLELLANHYSKLAPKWVVIGMKLDQEVYVRELIQVKDSTPIKCVTAVLQKWKESCKDVSWTKLCLVLRSVKLEEVAEEIQQVRLVGSVSYLG